MIVFKFSHPAYTLNFQKKSHSIHLLISLTSHHPIITSTHTGKKNTSHPALHYTPFSPRDRPLITKEIKTVVGRAPRYRERPTHTHTNISMLLLLLLLLVLKQRRSPPAIISSSSSSCERHTTKKTQLLLEFEWSDSVE